MKAAAAILDVRGPLLEDGAWVLGRLERDDIGGTVDARKDRLVHNQRRQARFRLLRNTPRVGVNKKQRNIKYTYIKRCQPKAQDRAAAPVVAT